jgi:hypothetical protein
MLHDAVDRPGSATPAEVRAAYEDELRGVVEAEGVDAVAAETGIDADRLSALAAGESPTLTLGEAVSILAAAEGAPDAETIAREVRDHLLMGMTTGVLDVDTIASNVDLDLSGQEIQQAVEGRIDPTLAELAAIHRFVATRNER